MDTLGAQLARVAEKLSAARKHDRFFRHFGADRHGYLLRGRLARGVLEAFEQTCALSLPEDFRRFILELGNGGAGPAYGWDAFEPEGSVYRDLSWRREFDPQKLEDTRDDALAGAIRLFDYGCGQYSHLVVVGRHRGSVWGEDERGNYVASRGGFLQVYEDWLDGVLSDQSLAR